MVPLATALSRIFALAMLDFAMSAHSARGRVQNATYEYIGGFSLTSDICADTGMAQTADIANTHSPAKTFHSFLFMIFILRDLPRTSMGDPAWGDGSVHPWSRRHSFRAELRVSICEKRYLTCRSRGLWFD